MSAPSPFLIIGIINLSFLGFAGVLKATRKYILYNDTGNVSNIALQFINCVEERYGEA